MSNDRLKFRLWDTALNTYRTDFYLGANGELFYWHDNGTPELEKVTSPRFIVEQCTGLKDKNGTLIYEGDILMYDNVPSDLMTVTFQDGVYGYIYFGDHHPIRHLNDHGKLKIVGNIHEGARK